MTIVEEKMMDLTILRQASKGKEIRVTDIGLSYAVKRLVVLGHHRDYRTVAFVNPNGSNHGSSSLRQSVDAKSMRFYAIPWILDDQSSLCMRCNAPFTQSRWRHHCRLCGFLVCHNCSRHKMAVNVGAFGSIEPKGSRVCDACFDCP